MPITILQPKPPPRRRHVESIYDSDADSDSSGGGIDLDGDVDMGAKSARLTDVDLVTPGELITDDPQWMRYALPLSRRHPPSIRYPPPPSPPTFKSQNEMETWN